MRSIRSVHKGGRKKRITNLRLAFSNQHSAFSHETFSCGLEKTSNRTATKPQPKPLTAETAGGAEIRRKSKGREWVFDQKSSQATKILTVSTSETRRRFVL